MMNFKKKNIMLMFISVYNKYSDSKEVNNLFRYNVNNWYTRPQKSKRIKFIYEYDIKWSRKFYLL